IPLLKHAVRGRPIFPLTIWLARIAIASMTPKTFNINRRRFLTTTAAITAATGVPGWFIEMEEARAADPKPPGPNDRPNIALVGCGGQGRGDCGGAANFANVVAVCDLDDSHAEAAAKQ